MTGPVHFIWLGGEWCWQFTRAIETAWRVHGADVILWTADADFAPNPPAELPCELRPFTLIDKLRNHPIKLANVKDYFMWGILHRHGGLYLDLDTISLRPAWDLLGDFDVCVSTEFPTGQEAGDKRNSAVVLGRKGAPVLRQMEEVADDILGRGISRWGATGPHLATEFAETDESVTSAPYPLLNGWSYHHISDYYANPRDPGGDVRVIHLYSSDNLGAFYADRWMP